MLSQGLTRWRHEVEEDGAPCGGHTVLLQRLGVVRGELLAEDPALHVGGDLELLLHLHLELAHRHGRTHTQRDGALVGHLVLHVHVNPAKKVILTLDLGEWSLLALLPIASLVCLYKICFNI